MGFVPAGEFIGAAHRVRTVELADSPKLPDGEYSFVDTYCTDLACDCCKTMILVYLDGVHVSTINFGWETADFYRKWMRCPDGEELDPPMHGPSIDLTSPNLVPAVGMLAFFKALQNDEWIAKFKQHYAAVKQIVAKKSRHRGKPTRRRK